MGPIQQSKVTAFLVGFAASYFGINCKQEGMTKGRFLVLCEKLWDKRVLSPEDWAEALGTPKKQAGPHMRDDCAACRFAKDLGFTEFEEAT